MKNVLRILAFTVVALALVYAPAAKAIAFTPLNPCEEPSCAFALNASGTGLTGPGITGVPITISLNLTGSPLPPASSHPNYGIVDVTGTVAIGTGVNETDYTVDFVVDPTPGTPKKAPPTHILNYDDLLLGTGPHYLDADGLLLDIQGLTESVGTGRNKKFSELWILKWVSSGDSGYYELQNSLVPTDVYKLTSLTATTTTPEPVTLLLFGSGLIGIGGMVRRRLNR